MSATSHAQIPKCIARLAEHIPEQSPEPVMVEVSNDSDME